MKLLLSLLIAMMSVGCATVQPPVDEVALMNKAVEDKAVEGGAKRELPSTQEFDARGCAGRAVMAVSLGVMAAVFIPLQGQESFFRGLKRHEAARPGPTCFKTVDQSSK